jgi:hypothetical protein
MVHPFFDEIRKPDTKLSNGKDLPPLFNFTQLGKKNNNNMVRLNKCEGRRPLRGNI